MKKVSLIQQFKQFGMASLFFAVAGLGMFINNSFDSEYIAKIEEQNKVIEAVADANKEEDFKKKEKKGVALNQ